VSQVPDCSVVPRRSTRLANNRRRPTLRSRLQMFCSRSLAGMCHCPLLRIPAHVVSAKRTLAPVIIHERGYERAIPGTHAVWVAACRRVTTPLPRVRQGDYMKRWSQA
jgi:hypothetical protein